MASLGFYPEKYSKGGTKQYPRCCMGSDQVGAAAESQRIGTESESVFGHYLLLVFPDDGNRSVLRSQ